MDTPSRCLSRGNGFDVAAQCENLMAQKCFIYAAMVCPLHRSTGSESMSCPHGISRTRSGAGGNSQGKALVPR